MNENKFDEFLDYVCSGIISRSEREGVRDELFDHLMCRYEINIATGMDDESASNEAINYLGEKNTLKYKLSQVHIYRPRIYMRSAVGYLLCGYYLKFMASLAFNNYPYSLIGLLISSVCILFALFSLRKTSKAFRKAYVFRCAIFSAEILVAAISPFIYPDYGLVIYISYILIHISEIICCAFLFYGLDRLTKPSWSEDCKKINLNAVFVMNALSEIFMILFAVKGLITGNNGYLEALLGIEIPDVDLKIFSLWLIYSLAVFVATLITYNRISKCLYGSDREYIIEESKKKKIVAVIVAVAVAVVPFGVSQVCLSTQKAEISAYTIEDYDLSDEEYNRIRKALLTYGIPEKYIDILPKSEIEKYSGIIPASPEHEKDFDFEFDEGLKLDAYGCAVSLTDEKGTPMFRYMAWIEYGEGLDKSYTDHISVENIGTYNPPDYSEKYNNDTVLILSEENGQIMKNEPLRVYTESDEELFGCVSGVSYQTKENMIIFYSTANTIEYPGWYVNNQRFTVYHRIFPLTSLKIDPGETETDKRKFGFKTGTFISRHEIRNEK